MVPGRDRARSLALVLAASCVTVPADPEVRSWGQGAPSFDRCEFAVVSWNTHKRDSRRFEEELVRHARDADLVLLQESTEPGSRRGLPPFVVQVVTFRRRRDGRPTGVATASTAAPTRITGGWTADVEPVSKTPKSTLITAYSTPGGPLVVVNLHGINFRSDDALRRQLHDIGGQLSGYEGPLILAGDFNTWSRYRRRAVLVFARVHALGEAFEGPSAPRLDHVLYRGLEVLDAQVERSRVSDHDALRVRFRIDDCSRGA